MVELENGEGFVVFVSCSSRIFSQYNHFQFPAVRSFQEVIMKNEINRVICEKLTSVIQIILES